MAPLRHALSSRPQPGTLILWLYYGPVLSRVGWPGWEPRGQANPFAPVPGGQHLQRPLQRETLEGNASCSMTGCEERSPSGDFFGRNSAKSEGGQSSQTRNAKCKTVWMQPFRILMGSKGLWPRVVPRLLAPQPSRWDLNPDYPDCNARQMLSLNKPPMLTFSSKPASSCLTCPVTGKGCH